MDVVLRGGLCGRLGKGLGWVLLLKLDLRVRGYWKVVTLEEVLQEEIQRVLQINQVRHLLRQITCLLLNNLPH